MPRLIGRAVLGLVHVKRVFLVADGYFLCVVQVDGHHFQTFIWVVALFYLFEQ
jgi:hypothetical protein